MRLLRPVYLVEPYSLKCLFGVYFNAITIRWGAICPTSCTHRIAVSFGSYYLFSYLLVILPFLRFVPLVVVVVPFCVFSLSEMLNASLISSFYDWFQQYPVLFDWFQQFPVLFNWFQHFPVLFNWFQQFPVLFDWFYYYPVF